MASRRWSGRSPPFWRGLLNGAMFSMGGLAAMFYPTSGRSSGVAWMYGVGRIGGILGPIAGDSPGVIATDAKAG
ncbi:hypothetical protein DN412_37540 [Cupriavidus lacunae]|uniref:Uncharacterized protein n=2 Tax=Cupriavidus lacunae TaxID=2666307 RepID=A0A370NIA9_9BURK|nr:hypothetical protein DN412_37540 [Cupriavidus lacunae]